MASLSEKLLDPAVAPAVQADARTLVDAEVSGKKGASGLALKAGYGAVNKVSSSFVEDAIGKLWPAWVERLDPIWQKWSIAPTGTFAEYLVANQDEAADALLSVTDERAEASDKASIKKVYGSLRGSAKKHVIEALPRLGDLVQKHAA